MARQACLHNAVLRQLVLICVKCGIMSDMSSKIPPYRVALIGDRMRPNTFEFMRGVLDFIQETEHWQILGDRVEPLQCPDDVAWSQVDGALGMFTEARWIDQVITAGIATVNMSVSLADDRLPRVSIDDDAVGNMGASYLLERGFPHLAFVSMGDPGWYVGKRREGFVTTVEQHSHRRCFVDDFASAQMQCDPAKYRDWLDGLPKPIGIMACNDAVACRVIPIIQDLGLRIPNDVAILGMDNDAFTTQLMKPQLSSIEPDNRRAGYHAAELLEALMVGQHMPRTRWIPPLGIVTRESTDIVMSQDPLAAAALQFITQHCSEGISVEDVCHAVDASRRSLERHMKAATGRTPLAEIRRAQISVAQKMLIETDHPIYIIARQCGFDPQARFFIVFKQLTGLTPAEFRRRRGR